MKERIYKFDNIKGLLIFLVVVGHLTTDYVSDYHSVRWLTLWIYSFHMPAFIFVSGLLHKKYVTQKDFDRGINGATKLRWDKVLGFVLCAYALKAFLFFFRTAIGQHPRWSWLDEPGIPWYLFVMAEYEILLYVLRYFDKKALLIASIILSAVIGYFPAVGDTLCLSRMINFLPIFLLGYCIDKKKVLEISANRKAQLLSWVIIAASLIVCCLAPWGWYSYRKYFTGRRSYEFLEDFFPGTYSYAWLIRLAVWAIAIVLTFAIVVVIPNRQIKLLSVAGERSLSIYFWHRPICYWVCGMYVFPKLVGLCGGYDYVALVIYILIAFVMTVLFSTKPFVHPTNDILKFAGFIVKKKK